MRVRNFLSGNGRDGRKAFSICVENSYATMPNERLSGNYKRNSVRDEIALKIYSNYENSYYYLRYGPAFEFDRSFYYKHIKQYIFEDDISSKDFIDYVINSRLLSEDEFILARDGKMGRYELTKLSMERYELNYREPSFQKQINWAIKTILTSDTIPIIELDEKNYDERLRSLLSHIYALFPNAARWGIGFASNIDLNDVNVGNLSIAHGIGIICQPKSINRTNKSVFQYYDESYEEADYISNWIQMDNVTRSLILEEVSISNLSSYNNWIEIFFSNDMMRYYFNAGKYSNESVMDVMSAINAAIPGDKARFMPPTLREKLNGYVYSLYNNEKQKVIEDILIRDESSNTTQYNDIARDTFRYFGIDKELVEKVRLEIVMRKEVNDLENKINSLIKNIDETARKFDSELKNLSEDSDRTNKTSLENNKKLQENIDEIEMLKKEILSINMESENNKKITKSNHDSLVEKHQRLLEKINKIDSENIEINKKLNDIESNLNDSIESINNSINNNLAHILSAINKKEYISGTNVSPAPDKENNNIFKRIFGKSESRKNENIYFERMDYRSSNKKKLLLILGIPLIIIAVGILSYFLHFKDVFANTNLYNQAENYAANGQYQEAIFAYEETNGFDDAQNKIVENKYKLAQQYHDQNELDKALEYYEQVSDYKNSNEIIRNIKIELIKKYNGNEEFQKSLDLNKDENNSAIDDSLYQEALIGFIKETLSTGDLDDAKRMSTNIADQEAKEDILSQIELAENISEVRVLIQQENYADAKQQIEDNLQGADGIAELMFECDFGETLQKSSGKRILLIQNMTELKIKYGSNQDFLTQIDSQLITEYTRLIDEIKEDKYQLCRADIISLKTLENSNITSGIQDYDEYLIHQDIDDFISQIKGEWIGNDDQQCVIDTEGNLQFISAGQTTSESIFWKGTKKYIAIEGNVYEIIIVENILTLSNEDETQSMVFDRNIY